MANPLVSALFNLRELLQQRLARLVDTRKRMSNIGQEIAAFDEFKKQEMERWLAGRK